MREVVRLAVKIIKLNHMLHIAPGHRIFGHRELISGRRGVVWLHQGLDSQPVDPYVH